MDCPVCGSEDIHKISGYNLIQCYNCGLFMKSLFLLKDFVKQRHRRFVLTACTDKEKFLRRFNKADAQIKFLEDHTNVGKLFDIGTGPGFLLRAAKDRGWEVEGNDPSAACVDYGKQAFEITIYHDLLEDIDVDFGVYNAVVLWNVLEHLLNPVITLEKAYKMLKKDGIVHIRVPNTLSVPIEKKCKKGHLYEFNEKNIKILLSNIGFKEIESYIGNYEMDLLYRRTD